jgi:hypothetical protein
MPTCNSPDCSCNRPRCKKNADRHTEEFRKGQAKTLKRLKKVLGLRITREDGHWWLTMGGYRAPAVIMHGFVSMKMNHGLIKRVTIPVGRYPKPEELASTIRSNHISYVHSCVVKVHEE